MADAPTIVRYTLQLDNRPWDGALNSAAAASARFTQTATGQFDALGAKVGQTAALLQSQANGGVSYSAAWQQSYGQLGAAAATAAPKMAGLGKSAKETEMAMRMLPAQITDITTSLVSGMPVWMVAIQQGGQIKDSFGGIGPAFTAISSKISLVTLGLAGLAIGAGAVAAAYAQGSRETDEYRRSIILTGNASGTTASQMQAMAARAADAANTTKGAAAEAVAQINSTGQVAAGNLDRFTASALRWERATGTAVQETAKQFGRLAEDPVKAVVKLNESTNFLTLEIYDQITALERQGRSTDAAALAQKTWADAMDTRSKQLEQNLGTLERAWNGVTGAAKRAWDAMRDIGREETTASRLDAQQAGIDEMRRRIELSRSQGRSGGVIAAQESKLEPLLDQQAQLQELQRLERRGAEVQAERNRLQSLGVAWREQGNKLLSDEVKMGQEIARAEREGQQLIKGGLITEVELRQRIAEIRKSYAKKGPKGTEGDEFAGEREAAKVWADTYTDMTRLLADAQAETDGLGKAQARLVEYLQSPAYATNSEEMRQLALQTSYAAIAAEQLNEERAKEAKWLAETNAENATALERRQAAAASAEADLRTQIEANERIGLNAQAVARLDAAKLRETAATLRQRAAWAETNMLGEELAKTYRDQAAALEQLAGERVKGADQTKAHDANMELWRNVDEAGREVWRSMAEGGEGAFERVLKTARGMWNDFIYEVAMRPILMNIASSMGLPGASSYLQNSNAGGGVLGSLINGFVSGGFGGAQAAFSQTALGSSGFGTGLAYGNLDLGMFFAKGGVPGLSEFSGQVVNQPTMFQFAKGSGVMGEAGAEGIFPLRRGPDGRLGIEASGAGGGVNNYYGGDVIVQVEGQVDHRTRSQMAADAAFAQRRAQRFD